MTVVDSPAGQVPELLSCRNSLPPSLKHFAGLVVHLLEMYSVAERSAPLTVKLFFWLILGSLSVAFAEVVSSSTSFPLIQLEPPYFNAWGIFVVFPLYTLHVLVLSSLIFRRGRVSFATLFLAGAILGLYEAYITKVIWTPTWGDAHIFVGGIAVVQTVILVLFWHPMMSFMLPVIFGENLFTASHETLDTLPKRLRNALARKKGALAVAGIIAFLCGVYHSGASANPVVPLLSSALTVGGLMLLGRYWRRFTAASPPGVQHRTRLEPAPFGYSFRDLLPTRKQTMVLAGVLALMYVLEGAFARANEMPRTLTPHLMVWMMYAALFTLLHFSLKRSAQSETLDSSAYAKLGASSDAIGYVFLAVFPLTSALFVAFKSLSWSISFSLLAVGCSLGAGIIVRTAAAMWKAARQAPAPA